jgi:hypothetical protein
LFTLSAPVMAQSTPPAAPATTGWGVDISARDLR